MVRKIVAYTDGGCYPNPGPGGWGSVIIEDEKVIDQLKGGEGNTTNNRMEIKAVLETLKYFKDPVDITFYSDSKYVVNSISKWIFKWVTNNFQKKQDGKIKDIKNPDLWREIWKFMHYHKIKMRWVKGHSDDLHNDMADNLASEGRAIICFAPGEPQKLYSDSFKYFLKHQIFMITSLDGAVTFSSRLEQRIFRIVKTGDPVIDHNVTLDICKEIHDKLTKDNEVYGNNE